MTWWTLVELDNREYWQSARHEYLPLPCSAATNTTRLRWWQRTLRPTAANSSDPPRTAPPVGWMLDDVMIGGRETSESEMYDSFETNQDGILWEFHPGGARWKDVCGRAGMSMSWNEVRAAGSVLTSATLSVGFESGTVASTRDGRRRSITTAEMVVQEDYMIQFKVRTVNNQCNLKGSPHESLHNNVVGLFLYSALRAG